MTTTTETGLRRLAKLASHLEKGKLGHKKFDFSILHRGRKTKTHCGSVGCALGECPTVFPKYWSIRGFTIRLAGSVDAWPPSDADTFFGLKRGEALDLFYPDCHAEHFGGVNLNSNATRYEVAANIRAFIKYVRNGRKLVK